MSVNARAAANVESDQAKYIFMKRSIIKNVCDWL